MTGFFFDLGIRIKCPTDDIIGCTTNRTIRLCIVNCARDRRVLVELIQYIVQHSTKSYQQIDKIGTDVQTCRIFNRVVLLIEMSDGGHPNHLLRSVN